jgi:hypothetical protein
MDEKSNLPALTHRQALKFPFGGCPITPEIPLPLPFIPSHEGRGNWLSDSLVEGI